MKLDEAVAQLVRMFGDQSQSAKSSKIVKTVVGIMGNRDVNPAGFEKLIRVGVALQKIGVK